MDKKIMNFFIFAAGFGKRLHPITLHTPKPLVEINHQPLLGRLIEQILPHAKNIFINVSWLGEKIEQFITHHYPHANIIILKEKSPLETGGALVNALHYEQLHQLRTGLATHPFVIVNGDIYTDYNFSLLTTKTLLSNTLAHLVLVDKPHHKKHGDFDLIDNHVHGTEKSRGKLIYSGISLIHPNLVTYHQKQYTQTPKHYFSLAKALYHASSQKQLSGEYFKGTWHDVGTLEILKELDHSHSHL